MTNLEKYNKAFKESLEIGDTVLNEKLIYQSIPNWDSVGHMELVAALEEAFDITMEPDDMIEFNSYLKGKEILKKYDVVIE